jgi:hypothetical protein
MTGIWVGGHGEDRFQEYWSDEGGRTLVGMFRWVHEDSVRFYELMVIEPEKDGLVLRVKHFDPGLKGWEAKDESVDLDLVAIRGKEAIFLMRGRDPLKWLVYRREGEEMRAFFVEAENDFDRTDVFQYRLEERASGMG